MYVFNTATQKRYNAPPAAVKDEPVVIEDVIDFFVKFIEIDQLGMKKKQIF
jgi:hypothetical protein